MTQYQKKLAIVSETKEALAAAHAERSKLECDVTTSAEKLQGLLARKADLLAVLTTRLTAHQDEANSQKTAVNKAIQDVRRELVRKWQTVRQPVLEKAARAVSALFSLSDHDVEDVANHSRLIYDIDYAVGFVRGYVSSADWPYTEDPVTLTADIEKRFVGLETYLASPFTLTVWRSSSMSRDKQVYADAIMLAYCGADPSERIERERLAFATALKKRTTFHQSSEYATFSQTRPSTQSGAGEFWRRLSAGEQWYWRGGFVAQIPDEAIDEHLKFAEQLPTLKSAMHLYPVDGAASRVDRHETAFSYRDAKWSMVIVGVDPDPVNAEKITSWTKDYRAALHPYSLGGAYVNFMMDEGIDRIKATCRDNYDRLVELKRKYDPDNFFHINQNIRPD